MKQCKLIVVKISEHFTHTREKIVWFTVINTQKNSIHRYFIDSDDKKKNW